MKNGEIFTDFQDKIIKLVQTSRAPGKHCARNAIEGIKKAWDIKENDPNMSFFRLITAEEESATAIFHALRSINYTGANKLRLRNHVHKNAAFPFLTAIAKTFSGYIKQVKPQLRIDEKKNIIELGFTIKGLDGEDYFLHNDPPLNIDIKMNGTEFDFVPEFETLVKEKNESVIDYLRDAANLRNKILYAAPGGIPTVSFTDNVMKKRKDRIITLLVVYLLIDGYPEKQSFVQCALNSFLKILKITSSEIKPEVFC